MLIRAPKETHEIDNGSSTNSTKASTQLACQGCGADCSFSRPKLQRVLVFGPACWNLPQSRQLVERLDLRYFCNYMAVLGPKVTTWHDPTLYHRRHVHDWCGTIHATAKAALLMLILETRSKVWVVHIFNPWIQPCAQVAVVCVVLGLVAF